jgi:uncharacterized membrane protein YedE/YeeE
MLMQRFTVLIAGVLFGIGLTVSGMVNPAKILNFLDLAGPFDASLIFVMGAGLIVATIGYRLAFAQGRPLFSDVFHLPTVKDIDIRLVSGAAIFGLGWGLSGFCPGPAIASLVLGHIESFVFVAAMAVGMLAAALVPERA